MSSHLSTKHPLIKILGLFSLLCVLMVITRIFYTGSIRYLWLLWNLFLAWLPLLFVLIMLKWESVRKSNIRSSLVLISWLLFFPNAPYILTDLFHLLRKETAPLWFDLVLILSFAWTGLLTGFVSLVEIQNFFTQKFGKTVSWCFTILSLILGSFGVYLGRYGRFNSWDVITNPFELSRNIALMFLNPFDNTRMFGMTFFLSCFLILTYLSLMSLINLKKHSNVSEKKLKDEFNNQ